VSLDRLDRMARSGEIITARLLDEDAQVIGKRCLVAITSACPADKVENFHSDYPRSDVSTQRLIETIGERAEVTVDKQNGKAIGKLVMTFVFPLLILANLFGLIFMSRGGDSSLADIAGFGSLGRKRARERHTGTGVTFDDVAGVDDAIIELREVIEYLTEPERFEAYAAAAPKGVLLFGSPGCGKTLLARAVAGESGVPFISVSGTEFVESLVGVGAARVRDLFRQVRDVAPAIVFIDEIDAVGRRREGEGVSGGEREQTLNQLLVEMDGFAVTSGVVLMGATNRPDILDPALLRPGRFDRHITLQPPDVSGRQAILEVHSRTKPVAADVDWAFWAKRTPGFTGADLANVVNEAALLTIREGSGAAIDTHFVSEAVQRVLHGPHRGKLMTPKERERIAYHEAGHAVMTAALGRRSDVHRISIVARGRGLGQSVVDDEGDKVLLTGDEIEAQLSIAMGGIAAEELQYGRSSTTCEDDIDKATGLAREMTGLYGMSEQIGPVRVLNKYGGFLSTGEAPLDTVSEETMARFDREVKRLITTAKVQAAKVLADNRPSLDRLARRLQEEESMEGPALDSLLVAVKAPPAIGVGSNGAADLRKDQPSPTR